MKFTKYLLVLILNTIVLTSQAKDIVVGTIEHGVTANNICPTLEDGDTLTVRSAGGSVSEARKLVACLRKKDVTVRIKAAYSAATFIVLGSNRVCLYPQARVGFHSPHSIDGGGDRVTLGVNELRRYFAMIGQDMLRQGYSTEDTLFIIGLTFMTPSTKMSVIPNGILTNMLKGRFVGVCNA